MSRWVIGGSASETQGHIQGISSRDELLPGGSWAARLESTLLPELAQWLPNSAVDEPIGTIGVAALLS
jgi:hypothetical protein